LSGRVIKKAAEEQRSLADWGNTLEDAESSPAEGAEGKGILRLLGGCQGRKIPPFKREQGIQKSGMIGHQANEL